MNMSIVFSSAAYNLLCGEARTSNGNAYTVYLNVKNYNGTNNIANVVSTNGRLTHNSVDLEISSRHIGLFLEVTYSLTNRDTRLPKSVGLATFTDVNIAGNDSCIQESLSNQRGFKSIANGYSIHFFLMDTLRVTDVTTYTYGSGVSTWVNRTSWDRFTGDAYMAFSWQNIDLKIGETKLFRYIVGNGPNPFVDVMHIDESAFKINYDPFSFLYLHGFIDSIDPDRRFYIDYIYDNSPIVNSFSYIDRSSQFEITHNQRLTGERGYHTVTLLLRDQKYNLTKYTRKILISEVPRISLVNTLPINVSAGDQFMVEVDVYDDSYANIIVEDEDGMIIVDNRFTFNKTTQRVNITFSVPPYQSGSLHNLSIFAVDEFGLKSEEINHTITIGTVSIPEIKVMTPLYFIYGEQTYKVKGQVRANIPLTRLKIYYEISGYEAVLIDDAVMQSLDWYDFTADVSFIDLPYAMYHLTFYVIDDKSVRSQVIRHKFVKSVSGCSVIQPPDVDCVASEQRTVDSSGAFMLLMGTAIDNI